MSLRTKTYAGLITQIKALTGSEFDSSDLARLDSLINLAAQEAYGMSQWWERWLVVAEPRTVSRGQIESTEDSFYVYGSGTEEADGLYQRNGTVNSVPAYSIFEADGTTEKYSLVSDGLGGDVFLVKGDPDKTNTILYENSLLDDTDFPLSGWFANAGTAPVPLLVDVAEIDTFLEVNEYDVYQDRVDCPIPGHAQGGLFRLHTRNIPKIAYVTYKKEFTDIYGDGTGGTTSDIPAEWFNYMALYASYMLLSAKRQANPSQYSQIAFRAVERALESELMRLEEQGTVATVGKRITTHLQNDQTLY